MPCKRFIDRASLTLAALVFLTTCTNQAPKTPPSHSPSVLQIDYENFTVWLDCAQRGAVKFRYRLTRDHGNVARRQHFRFDPKVPQDCQQLSTGSYQQHTKARYDRGHLVPANHTDHSLLAIRQSNYMTNVLPQASAMNRGAWLHTEEIAECYRDLEPVTVLGGVLWGDNADDDYFLESHAVATPDAFWKVLMRKNRAIAWVIPNTSTATRHRLDRYLVSIAELERLTGESIAVAAWLKEDKPPTSWIIPHGCDKS